MCNADDNTAASSSQNGETSQQHAQPNAQPAAADKAGVFALVTSCKDRDIPPMKVLQVGHCCRWDPCCLLLHTSFSIAKLQAATKTACTCGMAATLTATLPVTHRPYQQLVLILQQMLSCSKAVTVLQYSVCGDIEHYVISTYSNYYNTRSEYVYVVDTFPAGPEARSR